MTADRAAPRPPEPAASGAGTTAGLNTSVHDEVVRQALDAIVVTGVDALIRVWNPAAERLYRVTADEAIGRPLDVLVESTDVSGAPLDRAAIRTALEAAGTWRDRIVHRPKIGPSAGHELVVDVTVTLLRGPDGEPTGGLSIHRDVTEATRVEEEMTALGRLVGATSEARTMADVAQAALEALLSATGADAGLVTSTAGAYEAIAQLGVAQATVDIIVGYGQLGGPLAQALQAPDAYISADVATAPLRDDVRAAVLADGIAHLIVVGLRLSGRLTGILALGWRLADPREPSRPIMQQAAALIAASLENARLLAAVESGLDSERLLTSRMRALVELTRLPEGATTGESGLNRLLQDVGAVISADGTLYARVRDDHLALGAIDRIDWAEAEPLVNRPIDALPFMAGIAAGGSALLFGLAEPFATAEGAARGSDRGFRSVAAFAVREEAELRAVLLAVFRRPVDELEIDERTLEAIGRVLEISFTNRRLRAVVGASERRYRELFESAPDALLVQTLDDVVVDANPAAHRLYGDGLIGRTVADLAVTTPILPPTGIDGDVATSATGTGRRLDGSTFPEEVELRRIEIGGETRVMAIVRDLTERTRLQGELIQAQKMEAIGLLVAGVAHELNNPLAAIVAFSQLIRTDPGLPTDLRNQADMLVQEANRTRVIVQNLLDFARQRPPERVRTELRPLVDSVVGLQSYVLHRNHLAVEIDIPTDLPLLLVDRSQLQQVLINLTVNSAQAIRDTGRPGSIRIEGRASSTPAGPTVRIMIVDNGPGIPDAILERLFMPFVTTKEPGAGTGLGLSVSFGIIASHGGTLRHEKAEGGGARFVIELPVGRDEPEVALSPGVAPEREAPENGIPVAPPMSAAGSPASTGGRGTALAEPIADGGPGPARPGAAERRGGRTTSASARPIRVLVLDDEPSIRDFLGRVLKRSGYVPIVAATGAAALESIHDDPPDAIVCDHRMAGMSGTEFHAAVVEISPRLGRRFAFMSGDVLNPELRDFAEARGVHLLAKPFDIATVASVVAELLAIEPD